MLDLPTVARGWIDEILGGSPLGSACPQVWRRWVGGAFAALEAPKSVVVRRKHEQLPVAQTGREILQLIWEHFAGTPHRFEGFAADLWLMSDDRVASVDVTRPSRDGGRDATGQFHIGPLADPIVLDFALEAKCYAVANGVGVREVSRLISRLRERQFGVLVTTSYLADQAYQEIREDRHPVVVIAGNDIVEILSRVGFRTAAEVQNYLQINHPKPLPNTATAGSLAGAHWSPADPATAWRTPQLGSQDVELAMPSRPSAKGAPAQPASTSVSRTDRASEGFREPLQEGSPFTGGAGAR